MFQHTEELGNFHIATEGNDDGILVVCLSAGWTVEIFIDVYRRPMDSAESRQVFQLAMVVVVVVVDGVFHFLADVDLYQIVLSVTDVALLVLNKKSNYRCSRSRSN